MVTSTSGVVSEKQDLLRAIDYTLDFFNRWLKEGRLTPEQYQVLTAYYKENRGRVETGGPPTEDMTLRKRDTCWNCRTAVGGSGDEFCHDCGVPLQTGAVEQLRYLVFLCHEIKKHEKAGRLNLATAHDLMAEGNERIAALRRYLDEERLPLVQAAPTSTTKTPLPAAAEPALRTEDVQQPLPLRPPSRRKRTPELVKPSDEPATPRRSVIEILLDPRTIQWMLAGGGALLVLGLVIWLAAAGLFENKLFVAVLLGAGNAVLLAGGWALVSLTRFQTAGRAVTLLGCLLMPLNLWFYDAQGLIPLKEGGHLWIPALVCCAVYAASARLLKDLMFVPVFVGGVTLTGLLILADKQILLGFWEITAPTTLLVLLGLLFIHVERLFPVYDGPFSRRRFGLAFFWSGHAVLGCGLALLFVAQLFGGWLFPLVQPLYDHFGFTQPEVVTTAFGQWLALALVLAGTYAYVYSDAVVRRVGVYIFIAVFTLLWAEVLLITIVAENLSVPALELVIVALALTGLLANLVITARMREMATLRRAGAPLALFLCGLPVLFGILLQIRGTIASGPLHYDLHWSYVFAMLTTAVSCRVGAYLYRHELKGVSTTYFFGTAAATLVGAAGLLVVASAGHMPWYDQAPLLMVIPILYLIASRLYRGHTAEQPLGWVAHTATAVMVVVSVLAAAHELLQTDQRKSLYLMLALFFAEAALFYAVAAVTRAKGANVYFCTAAAFLAVWQLFNYFGLPNEYYTLTFAAVGLVLLVLYRFAVLEKYGGGLAEAAFQCGNAMLLSAFTAALLITVNDLLFHFDQLMRAVSTPLASERWLLIWMLLLMVLTSLVAVVLVRHSGWRRLYVATTVLNLALALVVLVTRGELKAHQKLEIVALLLGVLLLGAGHVGWYREQEKHSDLTSMALLLGSLLVTVTLTLSVLSGRLFAVFDWFHWVNELTMLVLGLLLLASGYACRLKATTLAGAFLTVVWLLSLVLYLRMPDKLQSMAVYVMIGGGAFFVTALLLSIYRERLLTMPERIKRREGVFRVLSWR